ncbi:MAG: GDP-mannose 4,6-dehydratase [Candidatus Gastranaerophilales bacterium]|nr:GDP-mannose 4,6-dehydratase [Candidatus Gastranaerophilales bacterium]
MITGFEGFLGSNLTRAMLKSGAKIAGLDIKTFRKDTLLTAQDYRKITVYKGSVANYALVSRILKKHSINVIFHLAAEAIVGRSHNNPRRTFETNIAGTWEVLEAARQQGGMEAVVVASSDKAYGSHKKLPYTENAPLQGRNPYDASKSCADLIAHSYAHAYGLPLAITRCGNIYGPGDFNLSRIVPDAIRCGLSAQILDIRSDGKFTRDYVYVDDIVNGYILLAEKLKKLNLNGEAFNFSDENPLTVIELLNKIRKVLKGRPDYRILNKAKYEIRHQYLDSRKARKMLGWKPATDVHKGVNNAVKWYSKLWS